MRSARRKRLLTKRLRPSRSRGPARSLPRLGTRALAEDPIQARVDLVRFAAFAEACAESMEAGPPPAARGHYEEACGFFVHAIDAAQRAGLAQEVARLKTRVTAVRRLFEALRKAEIRSRKPETKSPRGSAPRTSDF